MKHFIIAVFTIFNFYGFSQTIDFEKYNDFLKDHVSNKGVVNFDKVLKNIDKLNDITLSFSKISPNNSWTKSEYKAFWINFYNANIIKLLAENYPIKSINYINDAFKIEVINYDGGKISLDFIEHNLLRTLDDSRIHFALYSTATSSPQLKKTAYDIDTVEKDLGIATSEFLNDLTKNIINVNESKLSKVFDWYKDDFTNLVEFINTHSVTKINEKTKISYTTYDWNLDKE